MDTPEVKLLVADGTKEIVIRQGEALKPEPLQIIKVDGTIKAPGQYVRARVDLIPWKASNLIVNVQNGTIAFHVDERDPRHTVINGTLKVNPDLIAFHINESHFYTPKQLAQFLNLRRMFFRSADEHKAFVERLMAFSAKIETEIVAADDRKGNSTASIVKKLTSNLQLQFVLNLPIHVGFPAFSFPVEAFVDTTDAAVRLYLESVELAEALHVHKANILEDELTIFKENGCAIMEVG